MVAYDDKLRKLVKDTWIMRGSKGEIDHFFVALRASIEEQMDMEEKEKKVKETKVE